MIPNGAEPMLALPTSNVPLVYRHPQANLVSSLPYADTEINHELMQKAHQLVEQEMRLMKPKDYLEDLKLKESKLGDTVFMNNELDRIKEGKELTPVDQNRFNTTKIFEQAKKAENIQDLEEKIDQLNTASAMNNFKQVNEMD